MPFDPNTPILWQVVERFYPAYSIYVAQHDSYEELVLEFAAKLGKPRAELRLTPKELTGLLNFKELERLRDDYLSPLKAACHALFRTDDSTDFLDRLVNDIFHEISILKEEHYNVSTYALDDADARLELETILNEVHTMFPIKVHRLKHLFDLARGRLEKILPRYKNNAVLIRSLFLHGAEFASRAYTDGLVHFYRILYGAESAAQGFIVVGDSFFNAGFFPQAIRCYEEGLAYLAAPNGKSEAAASRREAERHCRRAAAECKEKIASLERDE
ncbi:MAG: hypothetical protein L0Z55_00655 [Planctomycetes bacterium]|nr:hypothetical protein [Planctomycetota bacterium]